MILFTATLAMVFLMAFQQQNVIGGHYVPAFFTSYSIAVAQYFLYNAIVVSDYWGILQMGTGGTIGVLSSMYLHRRWRSSVKNGQNGKQ
jgi:hypothetical protein